MMNIERKRSIDSISRKWALLCGVCTAPVFLLFAYFGDPGRGQAAWVSAMMIALASRFLWDLRTRRWFWISIVTIVLLHVPLILYISWPLKQLSYVALLPAGLADFAVVYGLIRLVETAVERRRSPTQA